jgi:hypothetical protein
MTTAFQSLFNSLRKQIPDALSSKNIQMTPLAKTGAVLLAGTFVVSTFLPEKEKNKIVTKYVSEFQKWVDPKLISNAEARDALWKSYQAGVNVVITSPLFYSLYHFIHRSGLPMRHHIPQSLLRGFTGTAATLPAVMLMYGTAAVALPAIEAEYLRKGYLKEKIPGQKTTTAADMAEATVFLGLGAPIEFVVEASGCGISPSKMLSRIAPVATTFVVGRLASGVLVQYRALDTEITDPLTEKKEDPLREYKDLGKTVFGTSIAQHGLNGCMRALADGTGGKGILRYLGSGDTLEKGTALTSLRQVGGTVLQRTAFCAAWNHLSHQKPEAPAWARVIEDTPLS